VRFRGFLGVARITMQVDIGFADSVVPPPEEAQYPSLLGFELPKLRCYRSETVISEKLEALVNLGLRTSRLKDYFDLWWLATQKSFDGRTLIKAVTATFNRRETPISAELPIALSDQAATSPEKTAQWSAFVRRLQLIGVVPEFSEVVSIVREFTIPVLFAIARRESFNRSWLPGGPWK